MFAETRLTASELVDVLRRIEQPIFYLNRPSILLGGVEKWFSNMYSVQLHNAWGMQSDRTFIPSKPPTHQLSHTDATNWLLKNAEVQRFIREKTPLGFTPKIVSFLHDETTEQLCASLGYDIMSPPVALRKQFDSKIFTTQLSEAAGIQNVPHIIVEASTPTEIWTQAQSAELGNRLVLQTAYGEGGLGTYFVSSTADIEALPKSVLHQPLKVMKHISHRAFAVEAVILPQGEVVLGPLLREIVGPPEVSIFAGSSSGLEYSPDFISEHLRDAVSHMVTTYGAELSQLGYLGLFEVDILQDLNSGELFFGESNPRFSGCAMVSNAVTAELWGIPLYALHLYTFLGIQEVIDISDFNSRLHGHSSHSRWANVLVRHIDPKPDLVISAPQTGTYAFNPDGTLTFHHVTTDWFQLKDSDEVFYMSYRTAGNIRVCGDDIGTLVMRTHALDDAGNLTAEAKTLVQQVMLGYVTKPLSMLSRLVRSFSRRLRIG